MRLFTRLRASLAVLFAMVLALALTSPASALTAQRANPHGTTTLTSPLLQIAPLVGISVAPIAPATMDAPGVITASVAGNQRAGVLRTAGGLYLSKADGSSLSMANLHHNLATGEVSAVVNDTERVIVLTATENADGTYAYAFTSEGAGIVRAFVNLLGIPADGSSFGTVVVNQP
ncbi:hypothetical protein [Intrasporangium sp.]|uniref:hypothetical protein n=1 Tax=Intrasporangium sp. TaxID=1925024 RepID=UPI00293A1C0C|nr:hypothetical protein [Intrasporangium sp.]MDV3220431.1 hypothetical protein [Intrasporangium sp.]